MLGPKPLGLQPVLYAFPLKQVPRSGVILESALSLENQMLSVSRSVFAQFWLIHPAVSVSEESKSGHSTPWPSPRTLMSSLEESCKALKNLV